jgi:hypothetical protein
MQLTVTTAATHKDAEYEDAFAPCPDCDDDTAIYKVTCSHAGTTIITTFVPEPNLLDMLGAVLATAARLAPRIDAAVQEFEHEHGKGATS